MLKIATHNSATGEKGEGLLSKILSIFFKCQNKTIKEQYLEGCRYFDFKIKRRYGRWVFSNNLWKSKKSIYEILDQLEIYISDFIYIKITFEGKDNKSFHRFIEKLEEKYKWIIITSIFIKNTCIKINTRSIPLIEKYPSHKNTGWIFNLIPIPIIWKKLYYNKPEYNEDRFIMVDFM